MDQFKIALKIFLLCLKSRNKWLAKVYLALAKKQVKIAQSYEFVGCRIFISVAELPTECILSTM